jgi:hypothetical protein
MSRLRRLVVSDRWFFITCRLLARRRVLSPSEFAVLAEVIGERRAELTQVKAGLTSRPEDWSWGSVQNRVATSSGLCIDRVLLPADAHTRI